RIVRTEFRGAKKVTRGRIVEVLARGHNRFVGTVATVGGRFVVEPDGNQFTDPVVVGDLTAKNAKVGDKVVVELTQYPRAGRPAEGVIVEVLGVRGDPGVDTLGVIRQFNLPDTFPAEVLEQAGEAARSFDPAEALSDSRRVDLRDELIITIDPATARDFDDAISLTRTGDGWRLGVHIADVARFVPPETALDREAVNRGNSVYFPNFVIPMLPEALSNSICSLQQNEDRLVKSAFITFDRGGNVQREEFANAVMRSRCRLTYEQAQAVIDNRGADGIPAEVVVLLREMNTLAHVIYDRRYKEGMLHLSLPKVQLELDGNGKVVDAHPEDTSFSHTIIEMFMIEANEAVARLFDRLGVPFIRRIHPEPPAEDTRQLSTFARICGHAVSKRLDRFAMQKLLANVEGKPESFAVNLALLRSLEQAVYSIKDEGHFALASRHYCHFTSPIRRYPDLHIHRLLEDYLAGKFSAKDRKRHRLDADKAHLVTLAKRCSYTERRAEQAERELAEVKVLELLSEHVGDHLAGVVTGVTHVGLFVQCSRYMVDGLVRFADMPDDYWELNPRAGAVMGMRSGKQIQIGDLVEVQIVKIDLARRELNLRLVKDIGRKGSLGDLMQDSPKAAPPRPTEGRIQRKGRPERRLNGGRGRGRRGRR
ncbi:MAG: VacB/RNase II family 3'-5' exoribonuclease, partial [Phycisphaerae bacterium]|nr:VacB/RNase II family 3'-5' exoribonuclease [Phycisphaerae bacterium]